MDSRIIELPKILDKRGNLSFIEGCKHIPFPIKRVYWIYDVPGDTVRGGHAFRQQEEFIVAISGSFDVMLDDGKTQVRHHLNRSYKGLYVPNGVWRHMENFSTNSLALVIASTLFDPKDYIRDYEEFVSITDFASVKDGESKQIDSTMSELVTSNSVKDCQVITLDKNHREMGDITVIENDDKATFDVNRVYYLYDVPGGEERGGHAHKQLEQLIIAAGGSFDVELNDGTNITTITLNRPYQALHVVPGIWRELKNFSSGATTLVLASQVYDENDYIRDYNDFLKHKGLSTIE